MAENLTPKKYIDSNNMKQILTAVKNEIHNDNSIITTEAEYLALPEEERLNNSYYLYDIGVHYKNGVAYSRKEPIQLTMEEYKALGEVDPDQEYIVSANTEGILLEASDISYSNAVSNLSCTTVQGAIDKIDGKVEEISRMKIYTNVKQLGLESECSTVDIFKAMPNNSLAIIGTFPIVSDEYCMLIDKPTSYDGLLTIVKFNHARFSIEYKLSGGDTKYPNRMYVGNFAGSEPTTIDWQELATMDKVEWKQLTLPTPIVDGKTRTYSIDLSVYKEIAIQTWINEWETNIDFRVVPLMESEMGYVVSYTNGTSYMTYRISYNKSKIKIDIEAENMASQNYPLLSLLLAR